jgi:hypothetical protein
MARSQRLNSDAQRHERSLKAWNQTVRRWSGWLIPRLFRRRDYIFIAALPKSGSTLLNEVLIRLTGHFPHPLCDHHLHAQNLVESRLIDSWGFRSIATHHVVATPLNVERLKRFGIRPVVLTRDLFDAAVSLRDHIDGESRHTATFDPPTGYAALSDGEKLDAIVDLALPWHLTFVDSWAHADIETLTIRYEDLTTDPNRTLAAVLTHLDRPDLIPRIEEAWIAATTDGDTRRNVGRVGRGRPAFSDAQVERLEALAARFPRTDFSSVGL